MGKNHCGLWVESAETLCKVGSSSLVNWPGLWSISKQAHWNKDYCCPDLNLTTCFAAFVIKVLSLESEQHKLFLPNQLWKPAQDSEGRFILTGAFLPKSFSPTGLYTPRKEKELPPFLHAKSLRACPVLTQPFHKRGEQTFCFPAKSIQQNPA